MRYYSIYLTVKEGRLLISDMVEKFMEMSTFEEGSWDKPITKIMSPSGDLHFMAFQKEYLEAMIAGVALLPELKNIGYVG